MKIGKLTDAQIRNLKPGPNREPGGCHYYNGLCLANASTPVLRAICADQVLAELGVALEAKDRKALGATSNKEAFKHS